MAATGPLTRAVCQDRIVMAVRRCREGMKDVKGAWGQVLQCNIELVTFLDIG